VPLAEVPDHGTTPDPAATDRDPDLATALAQLPDKQRQAVAYHYLGGLPYREVAAILGGTTDAARRAAADGIAALRRNYPMLAGNAEPDPTPRPRRPRTALSASTGGSR